MAFNGFEDADDNGGGGGTGGSGGIYRGAIDLETGYVLSPANITTLVGGTVTATNAGVDTITIGGLQADNIGGNTIYKFVAQSSPLLWDKSSQQLTSMSFVWPNVPATGIGYFALLLSDEDTDPLEHLARIFGASAASMQGLGFVAVWANGVQTYSLASVIDGAGAANPTALPSPVAGDLCHVLFMPDTGDVNLYATTDSYNQYLGALPVGALPPSKGLSVSLIYISLTPTTDLEPIDVGFGVPLDGTQPFQIANVVPVTLPSQAADGDYLKASVGGTFGTKTVPTGAYFVLITGKTDCIVLMEPTGTPLDEAAVNALIMAAIQTGQPLQQVVQAYIDTALINYDDKTGLNVVGTWDATSIDTLLSDFSPTIGLAGAVSAHTLTLITPLPTKDDSDFDSRVNYFSLEDPSILSENVNKWSFDFISPDMSGLDAALYIAIYPQAENFYDAIGYGYSILSYQDGGWSGSGGAYSGVSIAAGDRIRIKLNSVANTITVYRLADAQDENSQEFFLFYDVFLGSFPTGTLKANISMAFYTDTPAISTFLMYGSRRLVPPPEGMTDRNTLHVTVADEFSYWGDTLLEVGDFATFYQNTEQVAVMRLYTAAQIKAIAENLPLGVYRETGTSAAMNNYGSIYIALSDAAGHSYVIYTELGLVVGASTLDNFELKLTTDGDVENTTSLKDGLRVTVKIDTNAGGGISAFNTTGFYGEVINTIEIAANCITLLSYHVTFMFDGTWKWTLDSKSVL